MKNYGCGAKKLSENLDIPLETAEKLSDAYNTAYPGVLGYQNETQADLNLKGYSTNLYNRKYYIIDTSNGYKVNNYRIQGGLSLPLSI